MSRSKNTWVWVLVAALPLLGWWTYGLFDLDEGFYAAVTGEMIRRHEWITPFYNGQPWFEKPILLYWLAKPSVMLFGDTLGPRLPSVLATVATYGLVYWFARRRLASGSEVLAPLILGSSLLTVAAGRMMLTDPLLVLCLTAAFLTFWESLVGNPSMRLWTALFLGLGVLAKGPVALVLFALIAGYTFWRERELRPAFRGFWVLGILILGAVIASWYLPAYLANRADFVNKFLIEQNIGRFTGGDAAHTLGGLSSLFLYLPILLVGMAPWSFFVWRAWPRRGSVADDDPTAPLRRYLAAWAAIVFLFFSVSGAKLPHYVLPVCPPLALLVADWLARRWGGELIPRRLAWPVAWVAAMWVVAQGGFAWWYAKSGQREAHEMIRYVRAHRADRPGPVALYQLPRRRHDLGTGRIKLQETSLPSLLFYLDDNALEADTLKAIVDNRCGWVFTRVGRIPEDDPARPPIFGGHFLHRFEGVPGVNYELWTLEPIRKRLR